MPEEFDIRKPLTGQKKLYICGHRGDRTGPEENTMAAFRRAIAHGADLIETDVHMTKDGEIVLRHDGFIEGVGEIREHTFPELKKGKPDLPKLSELIGLAGENPAVGLLIELKDIPGETETDPAGPDAVPGRESGPVQVAAIDPGLSGTEDTFAFACARKACGELLEAGLGDRTWILSFSGRLLDFVYKTYGRKFRYHAFYPFFIMGEMETDPAEYCELACMQHRFLSEDGEVVKYDDPMCPESWWQEVRSMGMVPIAAPSLKTPENFIEAVRRGAGMINSDDPAAHRQLFGLLN